MSSGAARAMVHAWLLNIRSIVFEGHELPKLLRYAIFDGFLPVCGIYINIYTCLDED